MRRATVAAVAFMLGGCAASRADPASSDAAELAEALAGRTPGPPRQCIAVPSGGPMIIGDALLYREGRRLWVTRTVDGCPSLRDDAITITEVQGGQLCRNDRFRTVQRGGGILGPYCRFGAFVPYTARYSTYRLRSVLRAMLASWLST